RRAIIPAVDLLAQCDWIENHVAAANPRSGWQSAFAAKPALLELLRPLPVATPKPRALIQLRNAQGQFEDFRDTERTDRMRRRLEKINEAVNSARVELATDIGEWQGDFLVLDRAYINLRQNTLWRIFNVDFGHGGRFYGPGVQTLPKVLRQQLRLNGEPVAEPDYNSHHITILYALEGLQLTGFPYDIDPWPRNIVKRALLVLLNAPTLQSAIGALTHDSGLGLYLADARRLVQALKHKHNPIERHFHSGIGSRLQRIDSDMTESVLLGLIRQGIPGLPVHDSYIVPARYEDVARDQMGEAFETIINTYSASRKRKAHQVLTINRSYTTIAPSPRLPPLSVLLFDPQRRLTSLGRSVALDALRRRAVSQDVMASLVNVSRLTLANILRGRFGASEKTAARITEVIAQTPAFERQPFLPGIAA
ncbi:MAG: hypothetical protein JO001_05590, partial [Alphaproteobacteria bacterium]|nr:hypothetical protein [Alphaproteobacteria bacterium]